jgi:hypothetical protein
MKERNAPLRLISIATRDARRRAGDLQPDGVPFHPAGDHLKGLLIVDDVSVS